MQASINSHQAAGMFPFASYFLPLLPQLHEFDDVDLQKHATLLSQYYPHFPHASFFVPGIIDLLIEMMGTGTWHAKIQVLPVLQVLYYLHLPAIDAGVELRVMDCLYTLLGDVQVEVRSAAGVTLSGLIRCGKGGGIDVLLKRWRGELKGLKGVGRGDVEGVRRKHGVVLGLGSCILAFPYEVPSWMPSVLVELAGLIGDPSLISMTIKKMFSEFKRTHQDTWHIDSAAFSEDEIVVLNDLLISPSYYA
jgi:proteasome activator subunit 4